MFFCPNCDNMYGITKNIPAVKQVGGEVSETPTDVTQSESDIKSKTNDYDKIINKLLNKEAIGELDIDTVDKITKSGSYKKLSGKDKEFVYNKMMENVNSHEKAKYMETTTSKYINAAYFVCNNCGFSEPILPGTLVMSRVSADEIHEYVDHSHYKHMINVKTLPLTRRYVCPNKSCISHSDHSKREAVFFRADGTYRVRYICKACEFSWV